MTEYTMAKQKTDIKDKHRSVKYYTEN